MKSGANYIIFAKLDIEVDLVEKVIFTFKSRRSTLTKIYPDDIQYSDGVFSIPFLQEDTEMFSGSLVDCEAQINFADKGVSKTDITRFYMESTLNTELVDGNTPSAERNIKDIEFHICGNAIIAKIYEQADPSEVQQMIADYFTTHKDEFKGDKGDKGDKGEQGIQGIQGLQGNPGRDGVDGKNGIDGKNGTNGKDGQNGKDGYTPVKGVDYFDGQPGKDGQDGKDGKDFSNEYSLSESIIGKWIDGKPIYRLVVSVGNVTAGGQEVRINVPTNNIKKILRFDGFYDFGESFVVGFNFYNIGTGKGTYCFIDKTASNPVLILKTDYPMVDAYAVLEYTKTTD